MTQPEKQILARLVIRLIMLLESPNFSLDNDKAMLWELYSWIKELPFQPFCRLSLMHTQPLSMISQPRRGFSAIFQTTAS